MGGSKKNASNACKKEEKGGKRERPLEKKKWRKGVICREKSKDPIK